MSDISKIETFYNIFRQMGSFLHSSMQIEDILEMMLQKASEALQAKGAILRILNLDTQQFELSATFGLNASFFANKPASKPEIIKEFYGTDRVVIITDFANDPRVQFPEPLFKEGIKLIMDMPLKFHTEFAGIMRFYFDSFRSFDEADLDFAYALADQGTSAIDKVRHINRTQNNYNNLVLQTEKLSALGRMAAGIAHEINNPLAGILLYSSNLHKKVPDNTPLKEGLEIIIRETQRCKTIIQDLLEFSRKKEPQKCIANINEIIDKALCMLENEFMLRHITIKKSLKENIKSGLLDENQLQQVFVNLFLNAVQAIDRAGTITIQTGMDARSKNIQVRIEDTGCGIPEKYANKIFEPFFSTKSDGSGLGLAVSYGIIRNHNGQLYFDNKSGKGTVFKISLPIET